MARNKNSTPQRSGSHLTIGDTLYHAVNTKKAGQKMGVSALVAGLPKMDLREVRREKMAALRQDVADIRAFIEDLEYIDESFNLAEIDPGSPILAAKDEALIVVSVAAAAWDELSRNVDEDAESVDFSAWDPEVT